MRSAAAAAVLLLAACAQAAPAPEADELIECALAGAADFARDCAVERSREDGGLMLTVRHPDGGFRRFAVTQDGRGLVPADGAEPAAVALREDGVASGIEVAVGADRYRFPATVEDHGGV